MLSSKLQGGFHISQVLNGGQGSHRHQQSRPRSMAHDAVLVLDPSPGENFGHPVVLFYVDLNVTKKRCSHLDGIYLDECLTLALKGHCQNQLKHRQTRPERYSGTINSSSGSLLLEHAIGGLCEVHFLPLVVGVRDSNRTQRLKCVHTEFARCPQLLPMSSPNLPMSSCELNKNTRRCNQQPLATHLSCRLYQTCDHAVLISGWQQQMIFQRHIQNLQRFYKMLRNNGFHKDHIKTFFSSSGQLPEDVEGAYSAEKAVIRNHVSYICRKQHCADTLVLYLNSPTCNDGTMLLWDANLNGIADLKERYSVNELLADLAGCRATRVLLFVDQSYSGVLSKRLQGSQKHLNVVLIQSQARLTYAHLNQRLSPGWEDNSWSFISPATCLMDHLGKGAGMSRLLEPLVGLLNVTLAGAPCNATPPLTDGEMRREYQGCQNLPTALWHQK
uniref:Si:ch211-67e16.11 n=1 Tax=Amphilophus citrinellus TaxID=61819 RepID=A0A3Q0T689_AMPCI